VGDGGENPGGLLVTAVGHFEGARRSGGAVERDHVDMGPGEQLMDQGDVVGSPAIQSRAFASFFEGGPKIAPSRTRAPALASRSAM
jgi:hypothetical protein